MDDRHLLFRVFIHAILKCLSEFLTLFCKADLVVCWSLFVVFVWVWVFFPKMKVIMEQCNNAIQLSKF